MWLAVEFLVVYFLYIETKGRSVEGTATILDRIEVQEKSTEGVARATGTNKDNTVEKFPENRKTPVATVK